MYLKTGSTFKLASNMERIFKQRLLPMMKGEIRAKKLVGEDSTTINRSKVVMDKYLKELHAIYAVKRKCSYKYTEGDFIDLKFIFKFLNVGSADEEHGFAEVLEQRGEAAGVDDRGAAA
jgi:hypothetical protein